MKINQILLGAMLLITGSAYAIPALQSFGAHQEFWRNGDIIGGLLQLVLFQFLHAGPIHLLMNGYFLFFFGSQLEAMIGSRTYLRLFLWSTIFVYISLLLFASRSSITVGISGFCLANMSYLYCIMRRQNHPIAQELFFWIALNIGLGLFGGISLIGHLSGAIAGWMFFVLQKKR